MYQALYRKWRPNTFSEVVGQEHITSTLQRQVADGKVGHAYLFTGSRGTGKTTVARILAKAINCENPIDGAPCCQCAACQGITAGTLLDVTELDAASNSGVDQVRALREEAIYAPSALKKRVYIIDEVHMLSVAAFNALLKILEEPPEHLVFILATTELNKVLPTILSRCQRYSFKRILPHDIEKQLLHIAHEENIPLTPDGAEVLSRLANGALRDALSLLDQCRAAGESIDAQAVMDVLGLTGSIQTVQMMRFILAKNAADVLMLFDQLYRSGKDILSMLGELSDLSRDLMIMLTAPEGGAALLTGLYDRKTLLELGNDQTAIRFLNIANTLQECRAAIGSSSRPRTDAELCLLRLTKLENAVAKGIKITAAAPAATAAAPVSAPVPSYVPIETSMPEPPPPPEPNYPPDAVYEPYIPETPPAPVKEVKAQPVTPPAPQVSRPRTTPASGPAAPNGDTSVWLQLQEHYKSRLSIKDRVMLNMAQGVLTDDLMTVVCRDDFAKEQLDCSTIRDVLISITSESLGRPIRLHFIVGTPPKAAPNSTTYIKPPAAAPVSKAAPAQVSASALPVIPSQSVPVGRWDELNE